MSLTQTTTTTTCVEALQQRLQSSPPAVQALRLRSAAPSSMTASMAASMAPGMTAASGPVGTVGAGPTLTRRFSFVWPFISKENVAGAEPFLLRSRCSQLLRQFPALFYARHTVSTRSVRDLISRVLLQLKSVWLVLAVYMSLAVLLCLCSTVLYTLLLAAKPPGLLFLVACVAATGAIAGVSFNAKARPRPQPQQQPQPQQPVQPQQPQTQQVQPSLAAPLQPLQPLQLPKLTVN